MAGSTDARYRFCANVIVIVMIAISGPTRARVCANGDDHDTRRRQRHEHVGRGLGDS